MKSSSAFAGFCCIVGVKVFLSGSPGGAEAEAAAPKHSAFWTGPAKTGSESSLRTLQSHVLSSSMPLCTACSDTETGDNGLFELPCALISLSSEVHRALTCAR